MSDKKDYNKIPTNNNMEVSKNADVDKIAGEVERPKLQSVVGAAPKRVKRSLLSRLVTGIVGPEGMSGIGGYVSEEIIKPAVKNIIFDALTSGISMMLFGDRGMPNRGVRYPHSSDQRQRVNYQNAYPQRQVSDVRHYGREPVQDPRPNVITRTQTQGVVDDFIIQDRHDAAHVLTSLTEFADKYGSVSVAEYYDLIRVDTKFTDNNYGWRHDSIVGARIVPTRGGYVLKFPPVEVL
jgi:hypothetical protein